MLKPAHWRSEEIAKMAFISRLSSSITRGKPLAGFDLNQAIAAGSIVVAMCQTQEFERVEIHRCRAFREAAFLATDDVMVKGPGGTPSGTRMNHTWYVTFEVPRSGTLVRRRNPRLTKTFETEAEAREFARTKFEGGLIVTAGTINPYVPRRAIPSASISLGLNSAGIPNQRIRKALRIKQAPTRRQRRQTRPRPCCCCEKWIENRPGSMRAAGAACHASACRRAAMLNKYLNGKDECS